MKGVLNVLIRRNLQQMPRTAFSTSFQKLKRRVRTFQGISEMGNPDLNFIPDNCSSWKKIKFSYGLCQKSKYILD